MMRSLPSRHRPNEAVVNPSLAFDQPQALGQGWCGFGQRRCRWAFELVAGAGHFVEKMLALRPQGIAHAGLIAQQRGGDVFEPLGDALQVRVKLCVGHDLSSVMSIDITLRPLW